MKKIFIVLFVLLIALSVFGYITAASSTSTLNIEKNVKIGVIAGTTGQTAATGKAYVKGFKMAMEQWNASSTHTTKFSAVFEDDSLAATTSLATYKKLRDEDIVDAYAILSSSTIDAVYDHVHDEGKPVALGFEQSRTEVADNIFQVLPAMRPVQFALGVKMKGDDYLKPVAAVSRSLPMYEDFYEGYKAGYVGDIPKFDIGSDITDIRKQAEAIINAKPDVIAIFMTPKDGALLANEILKITTSANRPRITFDQSYESGADEYQRVLGEDISKLDGSVVSMSKSDPTETFLASYETKYNEKPLAEASMGYNSFMLLATTFDNDAKKWVDNISKTRFDGADGPVSFTNTGLRAPIIHFGELKTGKII